MLKQIKLEDAVGKTIKAITGATWDAELVIVFDDGTFAYMKAEQDYDNVALNIDKEYDFNCNFSKEHIEAGIVTQEEADEISKRLEEEKLKNNKAWRKMQYEELKREFES